MESATSRTIPLRTDITSPLEANLRVELVAFYPSYPRLAQANSLASTRTRGISSGERKKKLGQVQDIHIFTLWGWIGCWAAGRGASASMSTPRIVVRRAAIVRDGAQNSGSIEGAKTPKLLWQALTGSLFRLALWGNRGWKSHDEKVQTQRRHMHLGNGD